MQFVETTDAREAQRSRIAQFSGRVKTISINGIRLTGIVEFVKERRSSEQVRWIIGVRPLELKHA